MTPSMNPTAAPPPSAIPEATPETTPEATPPTPEAGPAIPPTFVQAMRQFLSPKRLAANRRNAQFSTGPRTEQGKKSARLNASRHGITGQVRLLPDAERKAVEAFCAPIIASFAPANGDEVQLVRNIAEAQWRLNRSRAVEENIFAQHIGYRKDCTIAGDNEQIADALHMASAFSEQPEVFDRLSLYEQRIRRGMEKDRQQLELNQNKRKAAEAHALGEAKLLRQYAAQNGEVFDPEGEAKENGGLVFSIDRLDTSIIRDYRLKTARQATTQWIPCAKAA